MAYTVNRFSKKKITIDSKLKLPPKTEPKSKYGNTKVMLGDEKFDSKKELSYYIELKAMQNSGTISELERQVVFVLQDSFRDERTGKMVLAIKYIADFSYIRNDTKEKIVIDVKASAKFQDPVYKLKKKLLLCKYRDLIFKEVY